MQSDHTVGSTDDAHQWWKVLSSCRGEALFDFGSLRYHTRPLVQARQELFSLTLSLPSSPVFSLILGTLRIKGQSDVPS